MRVLNKGLVGALFLSLAALLSGCNEQSAEQQTVQRAMAIESGEECHLCGMLIGNFPGPKGQLYERGHQGSKKFCSTRDLFAYLLDPEHTHNVQSVFVHDMAVTPWDHPDDETFIDGRQAWYVLGSSRKGAMGPTLASFKHKTDAEAFASQYGGKLASFSEVTLERLSHGH
ncbi:nitrous oxide reductase accessory protein NosL [Marinobacterium arenosum]|uniref:nitrous oxide reductase accessory protein NosL n=1 Tax=Marinobacterium arenosum TaxID=2862496 RepID=UPI001C97FF0C|nr:nitrous oxide reductase accessory protein NosL [Marinobacterium arenosum]MBY4674983.1 nitrous oxide reductase accessory protein NosL [Marinobacterium arenosum]